MKNKTRFLLPLILTLFLALGLKAQDVIFINLSQLDGIDLHSDNILNFQVASNKSVNTPALIKGVVRFKGSNLNLNFEFKYNIQPGLNLISQSNVSPKFKYSSIALKELFEQYKRLPGGIYEYCVEVIPDSKTSETIQTTYNECMYHRSSDVFLINLLDPEDDAKLYEYYPMLSWTANFPFLSALTYKISIAEIRNGQNAVTAIKRNNPVYEEKGLMQMSLAYPIYAKPLEKEQYYAWTVSAYYKNLLLGGSEVWKFKIVEDSVLIATLKDPSFVDIKKESGRFSLYAPGVLKLKYNLNDLKRDSLSLTLYNDQHKEVKLKEPSLKAIYGENWFVIDFKNNQPLKHLKFYQLLIRSESGKEYKVLFKYVNPELIK